MMEWIATWKVLIWFGYIELMSGDLVTKKVSESEVERRTDRGRPCTSCLNGVKNSYNARALELSDAKVMCIDGVLPGLCERCETEYF